MDIFIDESGFTGENFANAEQPVLVIASTNADQALCDWFVGECFAQCKARELKHSSLVKRPSGQAMVVRFVELLVKHYPSAFATIPIYKLFSLVGKMVDWWVEEAMRLRGFDLYERGGNIALANVAYYCLQAVLGDDEFRKLLLLFERMHRTRTRKDYDRFWRRMREIRASVRKDFKDLLDYFLVAESELGYGHLVELGGTRLEIASSVALVHAGHWRKTTAEPITVYHDKSKAMAKERHIWDAFISPQAPKAVIGYDRRTWSFPLNVTQTIPADSASHRALQLVDVLAGAMAAVCNAIVLPKRQTEYTKALDSAGIQKTLINSLWPSENISPEQLGTNGPKHGDPFHYYSELLRRTEQQDPGGP